MTPNPLKITDDLNLLGAARAVAGTRHKIYPVVDAEGRLAGIVTREAIDRCGREGAMERSVREITEAPSVVVTSEEQLIEVILRMQMSGADRCPVIDNEQSRKVVGFLSPSDILRARMTSLSGEDTGVFEILE
jgi:CBS domain-containing protein